MNNTSNIMSSNKSSDLTIIDVRIPTATDASRYNTFNQRSATGVDIKGLRS